MTARSISVENAVWFLLQSNRRIAAMGKYLVYTNDRSEVLKIKGTRSGGIFSRSYSFPYLQVCTCGGGLVPKNIPGGRGGVENSVRECNKCHTLWYPKPE